MQKIYQDAEQFVVWLGESKCNFDRVMAVIRAIYPNNIRWDDFNNLFPDDNGSGLLLLDLMFWLERPWWKRLWTMQETILARRLIFVCGKDQVFWCLGYSLQPKVSFNTPKIAVKTTRTKFLICQLTPGSLVTSPRLTQFPSSKTGFLFLLFH